MSWMSAASVGKPTCNQLQRRELQGIVTPTLQLPERGDQGWVLQAEKLVSSMEDLGNVFGDLGLSLIQASRYEESSAGLVGQYSDTGAAAGVIAADTKRVGMVRSHKPCLLHASLYEWWEKHWLMGSDRSISITNIRNCCDMFDNVQQQLFHHDPSVHMQSLMDVSVKGPLLTLEHRHNVRAIFSMPELSQ